MTDSENYLPLTPAVFHILLALSDGEKHGYAIMRLVEETTQGRMVLGPGTLYGAVKRLLRSGLIVESDYRPDPYGPAMIETNHPSASLRYLIRGLSLPV